MPTWDISISSCFLLLLSFPCFYFVARNGGYSSWGSFTACSKTCDGGIKTRTRNCSNPTPNVYGLNCSRLGADVEVESCNKNITCPGDWPKTYFAFFTFLTSLFSFLIIHLSRKSCKFLIHDSD